ncbi:hypothetical protein C8R42DRAFT_642481 [Lentinula raphanica]|nr:hypothetical protein C8R42DRAFT_642481 [Lentinula raphanica]
MSANDYYNNQNKQYYPPQGKQILLVLLQVKEDTILNNHSRLTMVEDLLRVTLNKVVTNLSLPHKLSMYNNHSKAQVAVDVVPVWQECACVVALKFGISLQKNNNHDSDGFQRLPPVRIAALEPQVSTFSIHLSPSDFRPSI